MRKVLLVLLLVAFVSSLPAAKAYLLPAGADGRPSKIVPLSRDVKAEKGVLQWLENTDNGDENYVLTGIADVDTFLNWFAPAAACSLLAYEVTNQNNYPGFGSDNFTMFLATLDQGINYASFPEYHANPPPSGNRGFATVVQAHPATILFADSLWTVTTDTLTTPVDNGLDVFGAGWVKPADPESTPNPYIYANGVSPYHTLMYRDRGHGKGWYSSYHCVRVRVLVSFYMNPPPVVGRERLPDSYNTGARTVNVAASDFGVPTDSSGVETCVIEYQVNGGSVSQVVAILDPLSGDSTDGRWSADIPGVSTGDTVDYWVVTTDLQGAADTTAVSSYVILAGTPGNFLFVNNGYTESEEITTPGHWQVDEWVGDPDSSVYAFYNTVVIRDWGSTYLGNGSNYGAGILYSDSTWVKQLLDRGGNFWISDQDMGYGFGICPNFGVQDVPAASWVQQYLGIQGMYDDHPLMGGDSVIAFGSPADPVVGVMFTGVGSQIAGQLTISPYYSITGNFAYSYTGSFDSLQAGAVPSMFDINGLTISYYYQGPGGSDYKVVGDFWPWDFITVPGSPALLDYIAVDALADTILGWFGYQQGIEEIEPGKVVELLPVGLVTGNAMIRFSLPERMAVSLDIYDNVGRLVDNLVKGEVNAGLHTFRWNADVAGVYFYRLKAGGKSITEKMVVIR